MRFLWLTITPLGLPVVPEEKGRMAACLEGSLYMEGRREACLAGSREGEELAGEEERKE